METKHTPGPWEYERRDWEGQYIWGNDDRIPGPDKRRFIADVSLAYDGAEANARLIAAAPDLLEALMLFFLDPDGKAWIDSEMPDRDWDKQRDQATTLAFAAIAKATGQS